MLAEEKVTHEVDSSRGNTKLRLVLHHVDDLTSLPPSEYCNSRTLLKF